MFIHKLGHASHTLFSIPPTLKEGVACEDNQKLLRNGSQMAAGLLESMNYKGGGLLERTDCIYKVCKQY